jgi:hypothetical protein
MRPMRVENAHRLFPRPRWVFIGHREHPLDQLGDGFSTSGLILRRDGKDPASGVVAGDRTRRGRVGKIEHAGFLIGVRVGFFIERTPCLAPLNSSSQRYADYSEPASARKLGVFPGRTSPSASSSQWSPAPSSGSTVAKVVLKPDSRPRFSSVSRPRLR